jgi:hypothetical protein
MIYLERHDSMWHVKNCNIEPNTTNMFSSIEGAALFLEENFKVDSDEIDSALTLMAMNHCNQAVFKDGKVYNIGNFIIS